MVRQIRKKKNVSGVLGLLFVAGLIYIITQIITIIPLAFCEACQTTCTDSLHSNPMIIVLPIERNTEHFLSTYFEWIWSIIWGMLL